MPARINPGGGPKQEKLWRDAIMRAVRRREEGKGNPQQLERLADRLVACGLDGDVTALKEIGDRLDGKAVQGIAGADGVGPVELAVRWLGQLR